MTAQDKKKPLLTMAAAIGSLCLIAACNSGSGASGYSGGDTTGGTGYYQQTSTDSSYPGSNTAQSIYWQNQAQQNQDSANQDQENINDSNAVSGEVDTPDDGSS